MEGGSIAILLAATYPDRVGALVLIETIARGWGLAVPDHPAGRSVSEMKRGVAAFGAAWGTGRVAFRITSDAPDEEAAIEALGRLERSIVQGPNPPEQGRGGVLIYCGQWWSKI